MKNWTEGLGMKKDYSMILEKEDKIKNLLPDDSHLAARKLEELKISAIILQTPVEAVYDLIAYYQKNDQRLLDLQYTWTCGRSNEGHLINVGFLENDGISVIRHS